MKIPALLNDFLTIKEFSELVGISADSLRHYDKKGIFMPAKRGNEYESQYRYYSAPQIITAKFVRVLKDTGTSLGTIKDLAESRTPEKVLNILCKNKERLAYERRALQEEETVMDAFIDLIAEGLHISETDISVVETPEKRIVLGDENHFSTPGVFMDEFVRFYKSAHEPNLNISFPVGAYWPDMKSFLNDPVSPTRFYSFDPKGHDRQIAGLYMNAYVRGYYGNVSDLPERMKLFAEANGLRFAGAVYGIYLFDEISINDPEQYLMKVSAAVAETRRVPSKLSRYRIRR